MADTQYKTVALPEEPRRPSQWNVRSRGPVSRRWWSNVLLAQDAVLAGGRRPVLSLGTSGAVTFQVDVGIDVDSSTTQQARIGSVQVFNLADTHRHTPGSVLEVRTLALLSGPVEVLDGPNYVLDEVSGAVEYTPNSTAALARRVSIPPCSTPTGSWQGGLSSMWPALRAVYGETVPWGQEGDAEDCAAWSADEVRVDQSWKDIDGARVISRLVTERGRAYVGRHNEAAQLAAVMDAELAPLAGPQTEPADGTTYDELRYGTTMARQVAEAQHQHLGPVVVTACAWNEADVAVSTNHVDTDAYAWGGAVAADEWRYLLDISLSAGEPNLPGYVVPGQYASRWGDAGPSAMRDGVTAIPVRVTVRYKTSSGTGACKFALKSSDRSWVIVDLPSSGGSWATAVGTGYLEASRASDDLDPANGAPVAVPLLRGASATSILVSQFAVSWEGSA